jgi:hypothetical protein
MKFINVSALAEQLNMNVEVVWNKVQEKLFEQWCKWADGSICVLNFHGSNAPRYHSDQEGVVLFVEDNLITYGSVDYQEEYHSMSTQLEIKIKDFDIVQAIIEQPSIALENVVQLSGEYTKEQLQEILNSMEE